jgi:hypothetical protein
VSQCTREAEVLFEFNSDQRLWQDTVREVVARKCPPALVRCIVARAAGPELLSFCRGSGLRAEFVAFVQANPRFDHGRPLPGGPPAGGTSEIQRNIIAERVLGLPRR